MFPSLNDLDRLATIQTPEGTICFTYLCSSKVGSVTKGSESLTYDYDAGLITSQTQAGTLYHSITPCPGPIMTISGYPA